LLRVFPPPLIVFSSFALLLAASALCACGPSQSPQSRVPPADHPSAARGEPATKSPEAPQRGGVEAQAPATATPAPRALPKAEPPPRHPFHDPLPDPSTWASAKASRYANLYPADCRKELTKRGLPMKRDRGASPGIATALRFSGALDEIRFLTAPAPSPYRKFDCRLGLTMDDLAEILKAHGVVQLRVDNLYRPRARLPGRRSKKSQHAYGLAMDVTEFLLEDGRTLNVEHNWEPARGTPSCGPEVEIPEERELDILLRNLTCDIARSGLFHHMLTPNHDAAHENHLHLDIKRDERRLWIR
jgi:hypothetical protein